MRPIGVDRWWTSKSGTARSLVPRLGSKYFGAGTQMCRYMLSSTFFPIPRSYTCTHTHARTHQILGETQANMHLEFPGPPGIDLQSITAPIFLSFLKLQCYKRWNGGDNIGKSFQTTDRHRHAVSNAHTACLGRSSHVMGNVSRGPGTCSHTALNIHVRCWLSKNVPSVPIPKSTAGGGHRL